MDCELATRQGGLDVSWVAKKAAMVGQKLAVAQAVSGGDGGDDSDVDTRSTIGEYDDFAALYDDEEIFPVGPPPALSGVDDWGNVHASHSLDSVVMGSPVSSTSENTKEEEMMLLADLDTLAAGSYETRSFADDQEYPREFDDMMSLGMEDDELSLGWCADNALGLGDELIMMDGDSDLFVSAKEENLIGLKKRSFSAYEEDEKNGERPAQRPRLMSSVVNEEKKAAPVACVEEQTGADSFSPVTGLDHLGDALCHKRTWETVEGVPRLEVVLQPLDRFYKDEGGANNFLICHVQLHGSVSESLFDGAKSPNNLLTNSVPLDCHLELEDGTKLGVADQAHLKLTNEPRLGLSRLHGELKFRLERTSKNYSGKKLRVSVSLRGCPGVRATATNDVKVLSKRKKLKAEVRNKLTEQALSAHLKNVVN